MCERARHSRMQRSATSSLIARSAIQLRSRHALWSSRAQHSRASLPMRTRSSGAPPCERGGTGLPQKWSGATTLTQGVNLVAPYLYRSIDSRRAQCGVGSRERHWKQCCHCMTHRSLLWEALVPASRMVRRQRHTTCVAWSEPNSNTPTIKTLSTRPITQENQDRYRHVTGQMPITNPGKWNSQQNDEDNHAKWIPQMMPLL